VALVEEGADRRQIRNVLWNVGVRWRDLIRLAMVKGAA
jgi:hypothetical protein